MNQNEQENTDTNLNDLAVAETEQAEIKGGPKRIFIGGLSVAQTALPDLEPQGEVVGGCNPLFNACGPIGNHNETITIDDLEASNADEIKGGTVRNEYLVLNATDDADEDAARRPTTVSAKIRRPGK